MTDSPLAGKVALVTGAARSQGRSHAVRLAQAGADVVILDIAAQIPSVPYPMATPEDLQRTQALVEAEDRRCVVVQGDVRDTAAVDQAVEAARDTYGRLDVAVANAGIVQVVDALETTDAQWADIVAVNLTGVFHTVRAASRVMVEQGQGGSIVCTGSVCSQRPQPGLTAYTASKHGVLGLVRSFALELAPRNIRVNVVEPGNVDTDMIHNDTLYKRARPDLDLATREDVAAAFQAMNVMPVPWVQPVDISEAVVWLASDASRFVTGIELPVDSGLLLV
ncbi:mycofactocin-coupled SDR family oxidoreductase [Pseudonocardia kujensis]|uniref:mycofactocin-coupled SDR family oxidoreductase n=1 Tax=Pseudonocardia kujensis TaxID=1128675 RepID=UPI001E32BE43|nr:mycofactocin-coupled SDR family oxidoreductase [Pseudonocardia kujensis]MCE0764922.1 mycofactocin-coupled SDR family oxidoreductase [Pseudonocardia kujensis]